jgi:hypothetical protein
VEQLGPDRGDAADGIAALKKEDGPGSKWKMGQVASAWQRHLIQTLLRSDLVDQYRLCVFRHVIGSGKRTTRLGRA